MPEHVSYGHTIGIDPVRTRYVPGSASQISGLYHQSSKQYSIGTGLSSVTIAVRERCLARLSHNPAFGCAASA